VWIFYIDAGPEEEIDNSLFENIVGNNLLSLRDVFDTGALGWFWLFILRLFLGSRCLLFMF